MTDLSRGRFVETVADIWELIKITKTRISGGINIPFNFKSVERAKDYVLPLNKEIKSVSLRRPNPAVEFFMAHPDNENFTFSTTLVVIRGENSEDKYIPSREIIDLLIGVGKRQVLRRVTIYTLIIWNGAVILSDVPDPEYDAEKGIMKDNVYNKTRREIYEDSLKNQQWVQLLKEEAPGYTKGYPEGEIDLPEWPEQFSSIFDILPLAFKDRIIENEDHPVISNLLGRCKKLGKLEIIEG